MFKLIKSTYLIGTQLHLESIEINQAKKEILSIPKTNLELVVESGLYDQFRIHVFSSYLIRIHYETNRGLNYAFEALEEIKDNLMIGLYEGGPDFILRGIIEGFYGEPWSHLDRLDVIKFLNDYKMNAYFYAPKDDKYHRQLWRDLYPQRELNQLLELVNSANEQNVDFYFCISPGNDFIYTKEAEFDILFAKIDQLLAEGVKYFSLLMDDIDYKLSGDALEKFERPGVAHAYISNRLNQYLKSKVTDYKLIMCPTEYWQNWNTQYRTDLKTQMDSNILVFWTGYNTIAEFIPNHDGKNALEYFGHPLILWDNYPVNDMTTDRIFMGPLMNRGNLLFQTHEGMITNPMIQWHLSKPSVITMADYMWDSRGYDPEISYINAIKELTKNDSHLIGDYKVFADNNRHSLIYYSVLETVENAIENLDYMYLDQYYEQFERAVTHLESDFSDQDFLRQVKPWFDRLKTDYKVYKLIRNNQATKEDVIYIKDAKHTIGSNIIAKLAKKVGLYDGQIYQKNRINYWDDSKVKI